MNGGFFVARAAAAIFRQAHAGAYVHITSTSGLIGNLGQANYSAAKLGIVGLSKSIARNMKKFNVRSNCVSPFAFSRRIGSIPTETEEQKPRVERLKAMQTRKIAPLAAGLLRDAGADVTGQAVAMRANGDFPGSVHASEGWTPETIADRALPALRANFYPLDRLQDVFAWDPV